MTQLLLVDARRLFEYCVQVLFPVPGLAGTLRCAFPRNFKVVFSREGFDRVDEIKVLVLHKEADSRTVGATPEAVIELLGFTDRE